MMQIYALFSNYPIDYHPIKKSSQIDTMKKKGDNRFMEEKKRKNSTIKNEYHLPHQSVVTVLI